MLTVFLAMAGINSQPWLNIRAMNYEQPNIADIPFDCSNSLNAGELLRRRSELKGNQFAVFVKGGSALPGQSG